jgi:Protein of unknown function (DUF3298)
MNSRKWIAGFLLSVCWQWGQAQVRDREDYLNAPDRVQWDAGGLYDGRFEDGTPFQIELAYPRPASVPARAVQAFVPVVWLPRDYDGTPSALLKDGDGGMPMRLAVAREPGVPGDEIYTVTLAPDRMTGQGVRSGPGEAGQRRFTLRRRLPYVGVVVTRPAPPELAAYSTYYREKGSVFSAFFPVLGDPVADAWVRQQAGSCHDTGECANTVRVVWDSASLLSLKALTWGDSGGAHGIGHSETRQYRIQAGAMTPIGLDAFIDLGPGCQEKLAAAIVGGLRAKNMSWPEKAGPVAQRADRFTPTPDGIAFHYDSYEVGPYAEGAPTVFVPREKMAGCVRYLPDDD